MKILEMKAIVAAGAAIVAAVVFAATPAMRRLDLLRLAAAVLGVERAEERWHGQHPVLSLTSLQ